MEAASISTAVNNSDKQVIDGLRENLEDRNAELLSVKDELTEKSEKLKAARSEVRQQKVLNKQKSDVIAELEKDLESAKATVLTASENTDSNKIQMALFRLDTIIRLNQGQKMIDLDQLRLVVEDLAGEEKAGQLLLGN